MMCYLILSIVIWYNAGYLMLVILSGNPFITVLSSCTCKFSCVIGALSHVSSLLLDITSALPGVTCVLYRVNGALFRAIRPYLM